MAQIALLEGADLGLLKKEGSLMSKSRLSALPPPLEFADGFGFLEGIVTKEIAVSSGVALGGGAAFGLLTDLGLPKLTFLISEETQTPIAWRFAAANLLLGAVVGRALWNVGYQGGDSYLGRDAAKGLLGVAGANIARSVVAMVKGGVKATLDGLSAADDGNFDPDIDLSSLSAEPEDILLSDASVEQLEDADVSERRPGQLAAVESWLS